MGDSLRSHWQQHPKTTPVYIYIFSGILISIVISLLLAFMLAAASLIADTTQLETHSNWVVIGVIMLSIFIGSAFATHKCGRLGLPVGITVGIVYVLLLIVLGLQMNGENITAFAFINKLIAGSAAGACGGIVGVNL